MAQRTTGTGTGLTIALIVAALLAAMYLGNVRFFEVLEEKTLDLRFVLRGPVAPGPETVIAAIDEKSISRLGRFPWPRSVWGRVVEQTSTILALRIELTYFSNIGSRWPL